MSNSQHLYYDDSFLKTFTAKVDAVRESDGGEGRWRVALDRSAFYPTSGGQPFDRGVLIPIAQGEAGQGIEVEDVSEGEDGTVWHTVRVQVAAGTRVEGRIDWERRFDHMQQHTGQHLLSAVFWSELKAHTVSFHLGEESATIDLSIAPPSAADLQRVERIANEIIAEDRPVSVRMATREDAEAMLAAGELRKLPEREGSLRVVEIADCDLNACGGTHVRSTGQIGSILLRKIEKVSRGVRVEFLCGLRAVRRARAEAEVLAEAGALLSVGVAELAGAIGRVQAESKSAGREIQKLRGELAVLEAAKLVAETPVENGVRLLVRSWKDKDREFVKLLASRTAAAAPGTAVVFFAEEADPFRVLVGRSGDLGFNCGQFVREELAKIGLRGGGSADMAQGDVPAEKAEELRTSIVEAIRGACNV
ncbi:MAG: alanyl-tRNA editing protein [Acidobacteriota bacterium]